MFERIREDFATHGRRLRNRGFWALVVYRFGVWSMNLKSAPLRWATGKIYGLANQFSEIITGITMDRHVRIGRRLRFIHAATIFIHPDVVIGDDVAIMHNVTIGTNMGADVPVIGNQVFIGTGASILGKLTVGDGARIGANSYVINDVPPGGFAVGVPAKNLRGDLAWKPDEVAAAIRAKTREK